MVSKRLVLAIFNETMDFHNVIPTLLDGVQYAHPKGESFTENFGGMMKFPIYQVDAFTDRPFGGNPAAVCPLKEWLEPELMQKIAMENNLSETAFFVKEEDGYSIRWFTPAVEIDLAGHPTLATAHVISKHLKDTNPDLLFYSKSGPLRVRVRSDHYLMNFPARPGEPMATPSLMVQALGVAPEAVYQNRDWMAVFQSEKDVLALDPDFSLLAQLDCFGVIVTAPGVDVDFVSRFFAPRAGIPEDPVTGSAHTTLIPYWSARLNKKRMKALQVSTRQGALSCELYGDRVGIGGQAVTVMEGSFKI